MVRLAFRGHCSSLILVVLVLLVVHGDCTSRQEIRIAVSSKGDRHTPKPRVRRTGRSEAWPPSDAHAASSAAVTYPGRVKAPVSSGDHAAPGLALLKERIGQLNNSGQVVQCGQTGLPPLRAAERYLVAVNLHDSQDLMPHFISQLLKLLSYGSPQTFYVSIYESGTDTTAEWLELLQEVLVEMGVDNRIVTNGTQREKDADRIAFLAYLRNQALAPLFGPADLVDDVQPATHKGGSLPGWPADRIIFINDVYFCAEDVLRLLSHPGDVVCGMDFATRENPSYPSDVIRPFGPLGHVLANRQPEDDRHMIFYDMWVARDANGQPFSNYKPFVTHLYSLERLQQGLPFPVKCCWNGLAVLDAEPFRRGVRFRAHVPGECRASEVSLMCEDFHKQGYNKMLIDPGVRQAYTAEDAAALYGDRVSFIPFTSFRDMQAAPAVDFDYVANKTPVVCCDKHVNNDDVHWGDCHPVDWFQTSAASRANASLAGDFKRTEA